MYYEAGTFSLLFIPSLKHINPLTEAFYFVSYQKLFHLHHMVVNDQYITFSQIKVLSDKPSGGTETLKKNNAHKCIVAIQHL